MFQNKSKKHIYNMEVDFYNTMKNNTKLNKCELILDIESDYGVLLKSENEVVYFNAEDFIYMKKKGYLKEYKSQHQLPVFYNPNTNLFSGEFGVYNKSITPFDIEKLISHNSKLGVNLNGTHDIINIIEENIKGTDKVIKIKSDKEYKYVINNTIANYLIINHDIKKGKFDNELKIEMKINHVHQFIFLNIKYKNEEQLFRIKIKKYIENYE